MAKENRIDHEKPCMLHVRFKLTPVRPEKLLKDFLLACSASGHKE